MPPNIIDVTLLSLIRLCVWIFLLLFIAFSLIVVRQVQLMTKVLSVPVSGSLKFVALGLLTFAIGIFLFSLVVL